MSGTIPLLPNSCVNTLHKHFLKIYVLLYFLMARIVYFYYAFQSTQHLPCFCFLTAIISTKIFKILLPVITDTDTSRWEGVKCTSKNILKLFLKVFYALV